MIKAVLLILEKEGKIIFVRRTIKRTSLPGKWALPSEKIEEGETKEEATIRCADEELGVKLENVKLFKEYHFKDEHEEKVVYFMKANYIGKPFVKDKEEFDEFIGAGDPPIVFTFGSAMRQGHALFHHSVEACERLGRRGVFLTSDRSQLPSSLPKSMKHFSYITI